MLSAEQKKRFAEDGLVFIDPGVDSATIDGIVARVGVGMLGTPGSPHVHGETASRPGSGRVQDAWRFDSGVKALATAPAVLSALEELYGRKPRPFQTLNFRLGTEQKAHSDTVHFNSDPAGFMCGVWTALEDIDESNGAVIYYPGSQKRPEYNLAHVFAESDLAARRPPPTQEPGSAGALWRKVKGLAPKHDIEKDYLFYEEFLQRKIDEAGLKPALATLKKGQAFVWAANLLHGGSRQRAPNRTRLSQVTHYFFEGCKYYRPLQNSDGKVRHVQPDWVE